MCTTRTGPSTTSSRWRAGWTRWSSARARSSARSRTRWRWGRSSTPRPSLLNDLFQQALRVGKRAHSETGIDRAGQSLVTFGLEQLAAGADVADWAGGKRALVIGAGSMSSLAAATLARTGVAEIVVANRTRARADRLVEILAQPGGTGVAARAVEMAAVRDELTRADVVVSCTGATGLVLTAGAVAEALGLDVDDAVETPAAAPAVPAPADVDRHAAWVENGSAGTVRQAVRRATVPAQGTGPVRLALLDLAMPRDIDGAAARLDGVRLVDIESLAEASADAPMAADVDQVRTIVADEVAAFGAAQRAAHITPTVVALRTMAAGVVAGEIARLDGRLPDLDEKQRAEISQTVRRVVDKLLHAPTVRVKQLASEPGGAGYADALRELFDLDPQTVAAVSRADLNDPNRGRS